MRHVRSSTVVFFSALLALGCASKGSPAPAAAGGGGQNSDASSGRAASGQAGATQGNHSENGGRGGANTQGKPSSTDRCADSALTWKTANKTNYTSYPEPGSEECIAFSGCKYQGELAACDSKQSETWISQHNIVAIFPDLNSHKLHDLCLSRPDGSDKIIVTVYDTCADTDCDGCCSQNRGRADALIDVEHYTDERWGVADGPIKWADLGPTSGDGCQGN